MVKKGRTTTYTSGNINRMRRRINWQHLLPPRISHEMEIMSHDGNFSEPGDSGSLVINSHGEMVGMLFATDPYPGNFAAAFMTPSSVIQQDVKRLTNGGYLSLD